MAPASAAPTTPSSGSPDPSNLASEQAQIDIARAALARGRPADALRSLGEHSRLYPSGKLREEREALAVQALAQSGQKTAAASRAERFRRSFPNSFFGPVVEQAVAEPAP
jgi:outer membrane protein assembly factor BamD (BamD/ComL family)